MYIYIYIYATAASSEGCVVRGEWLGCRAFYLCVYLLVSLSIYITL